MDFEYSPQQLPSAENLKKMPDSKLEGEERERFLEKIYTSGRAGFYTNFSGIGFTPNAGWQTFEDARGSAQGDRSPIANEMRREIKRSRFSSADKILGQEGINAIITIMPVIETSTTYREERETVVERKGFLGMGKKVGEQVRRIPTGSVDKPETLSRYSGDNHNAVPAYKIMYYRPDARAKWAARGRANSFTASIILPKETAEETFATIEKNPSLMRYILRKFRPDFMSYIEADGQFPPDKKVLLIPEGIDAFVSDQTQREKPITGVKKEFIKEVPAT